MTIYSSEIRSWKELIKSKWVIFDTDAIISITAFDRVDILHEMADLTNGFAIIHPVELELMNTNNAKDRLKRSKLLVDFDFISLPYSNSHASLIQRSMPISSTASPADLYLGATLMRHNNDRFLLTANIKDFPMPIYTREGHLLLQDDSKLKLLTFLSMDVSKIISN